MQLRFSEEKQNLSEKLNQTTTELDQSRKLMDKFRVDGMYIVLSERCKVHYMDVHGLNEQRFTKLHHKSLHALDYCELSSHIIIISNG